MMIRAILSYIGAVTLLMAVLFALFDFVYQLSKAAG